MTRWTPRRKAELAAAIGEGRVSLAEAQAAYGLSAEEIAQWRRDLAEWGEAGLRSTRLQIYHPERRRAARRTFHGVPK